MSKPIRFQCKWDSAESIPLDGLQEAGIGYRQAYSERQAMALVAAEKKRLEGDCLCRIPFCVTVEAEAFGAAVHIPDSPAGPTVREYRFRSLEELAALEELDLSRGRIHEVLQCARLLSGRGETVAVNVEGPFTILGLLLEPVTLFKSLYRQRRQVEEVLVRIEASIVKYMLAAEAHGAKIISYADPTGARELVGAKLFDELCGRSSWRVLKQAEAQLQEAVVHVCGIASLGLEQAGFCTAAALELDGVRSYGESLCWVQQHRAARLVGHNCMKCTPAVLQQPRVWQLEMK